LFDGFSGGKTIETVLVRFKKRSYGSRCETVVAGKHREENLAAQQLEDDESISHAPGEPANRPLLTLLISLVVDHRKWPKYLGQKFIFCATRHRVSFAAAIQHRNLFRI
jgi:hypothetical protein